MIMFSQEILTQWLISYGYLALIVGVIIEGPLITILGGFLSSIGIFNILYAYLVIVSADIVADWIAYTIGYFGRKKILIKIFGFLKIPAEKILDLDVFFKKHGGKSVFISKFVAGAGTWTILSAGISRMKLTKFLGYTLSASVIKSAVYIAIGYFFGSMYKLIDKWLSTIGTIVSVLIIAVILFFIFKRHLKNKKSKN